VEAGTGEPLILHGRHPVIEALRAGPRRVDEVLIARDTRHAGEVAALARSAGVRCVSVPRTALTALAGTPHHQGVVARVATRDYASLEEVLAVPAARGETAWLLVLDQIQDPGNVGNLFRTAAALGVDVAQLQVKINEGALYPTLAVSAGAQQAYESSPLILKQFQATVLGTVSVPLYQGGSEYATIRQSKETLGKTRIDLDTQRDVAQQATVQAWGQLEAAKAQILATQAQVLAAETALNGVREEARVGQRTTLDVLNAQQELVNARVALVSAQRDRVVASFALLAATGRLSVAVLGLNVRLYDPLTHYQQVRDTWIGVRTPDGR